MLQHSSPIMSSTSTPAASPRKTMDLTLTPRTKIRALLASVDDDDDDSDKENETAAPIIRQSSPAMTRKSAPRSTSEPELQSDPDEDVVRPRARKNTVLARLLEQDENAVSSGEDSVMDTNAYDRIRKQLIMTKEAETATNAGGNINADSNASSDSDGIAISRRTTKRKRVERQPSPAGARTSAARPTSPGLFVSSPEKPRSPPPASDQNSDSDDLPNLSKVSRLQALVAKKREERLAREAASEQANEGVSSSPAPGRSSTKKKTPRTSKVVQVESETDDDRDIADKLTSSARPTRKASKRAMEEMHRETQRMSRNMQLTHEAKTKTKFTTDALFKKFGFRQSDVVAPAQAEQGTSATSSIPGTSDSEKLLELGTPPSSPPMLGVDLSKSVAANVMRSSPLPTIPDAVEDDDVELPDIHSALSQMTEEVSKARSVAQPQCISAKKFGKSVRRPVAVDEDDEDDGLEIVQDKEPSRLDIFDLIKPAKSHPTGNLHVVRALANVNDTAHAHGKKSKPSMTVGELQLMLQRRAREQAQRDREEKIQRLREKGIYVQTAEEKEKEQLQVEDMLEKARREADELAKREKEAAKKEGREVGGAMPDSDDEGDEDWDGDEEEVDEAEGTADVDIELSGSEEEEDAAEDDDDGEEEEEEDVDNDKTEAAGALIDEEAEDASDEDDDHASVDEGQEMVVDGLSQPIRRPRKKIVDSDDEEAEPTAALLLATASTPARTTAQVVTPKSVLADAFGFAQPQAITGGLSQMFAGTMAESQTSLRGDTQAFDSQQDSLAFLRGLAPPDLPMPEFSASLADDSQDVVVPNSQAEQSQSQEIMCPPGLFRFETQTQLPYFESQEMSQVPEPTQDVGFQHFPTPAKPAAAQFQESFATVDTVALSPPRPAQQAVLSDDDQEDLVKRRKGRLVRRQRRANVEVEDEVIPVNDLEEEDIEEAIDTEQNAFLIMRQAATKPTIPTFDKKRSEAKGMIEEQAEESEDEYAGLGGASDSEDDEYDEETRKMIDDDSKEKLNERAVAKFHADKERAEDEKRVERLFKDIANGGLRRKRGAEMELWESDDEDEAMARRRAAKQREFAKMRKALLADEKLGKIAENPKQQAFLAAIEDHDEDDSFDLLGGGEEESQPPTFSQVVDESQSQDQVSADTDVHDNTAGSSNTARLPPNLRRTARSSKPSSLLEIRNTLSELIGEDSLVSATAEDEDEDEDDNAWQEGEVLLTHQDSMDIDIDLDNDDDGEVNDLAEARSELMPPPPAPVSASLIPARAAAIDRRRRSHPKNQSQNQTTLAFAPTSATLPTFFRKPSLLRRATTASSTDSNTNTNSNSNAAARGGLGGDNSIRMGGTNKSSINYHVREKEKMARVERVERERAEGRERVGRMRRGLLIKGAGDGKGMSAGGGKLGSLVGGGGGAWE